MGCGGSVESGDQDDRGAAASASGRSFRNASRLYIRNADENEALHVLEYDFEYEMCEEERVQLQKLEDEWSIHSRGDYVDEPTAFNSNVRMKKRISAAKTDHSINGDPCQFEPTPEPRSELDKSAKIVMKWMVQNEELDMLLRDDTDFSDRSESTPRASQGGLPEFGTVSSVEQLLRSPGAASGLSPSASALTLSAKMSMVAVNSGRDISFPMRGSGSDSQPAILATPGTPFLGASPARVLPLRMDVLAAHQRRLKAIEKQRQQQQDKQQQEQHSSQSISVSQDESLPSSAAAGAADDAPTLLLPPRAEDANPVGVPEQQ